MILQASFSRRPGSETLSELCKYFHAAEKASRMRFASSSENKTKERVKAILHIAPRDFGESVAAA
jgi:hypothetical protein